jgi:hypothetical protein
MASPEFSKRFSKTLDFNVYQLWFLRPEAGKLPLEGRGKAEVH